MPEGQVRPSGTLGLRVIRAGNPDAVKLAELPWPGEELSVLGMLHHGLPRSDLSDAVNRWRTRNLPNLWRGARHVLAARTLGVAHAYGALYLSVLRADGIREDLGLASLRVVTTAGVGFIVDAFQNAVELETMKYHGLGTGTNAEASSDTALQTELATEYSPNNTRATGSTTEAAANIYRTVGTNTVDASAAVTEHGVLSQAATGGGVLLDRSVFAVINLVSSDSLQTTYDLTITAGG